MSSNLPKHGIQAVIENLPNFLKGMDSVNKKIDDASKVAQNAAKNISPANKALGDLSTQLQGVVSKSGPTGNALAGIIDKIGGIPPAALLAVTAIAAIVVAVVGLGKAFFDLGNRGAPLQEIGIAFDHITASVGLNSQKLLKGLQEASDGLIANFDLIRISSKALVGVTGDFGTQFGEKLPALLKIARVEADATGKSLNDIFENLTTGIKKGTPKLIESTGLIIDQKAAYQGYASTLGITVAQLSDTDKSQALLNATLAAGQVVIDSLRGSAESNADKLDRINATITNTFDGLAIAVQPVFGLILDGVQKIINVFAGFAPYLAIIFNFIGKVIAGIVNFLVGIIPPDLPKRLFEGAAAAFGSFANAIIQVANKLIFPAVIAIAKFIADFLIGFSPPKEGPLSQIDKGGENLMLAWLSGISGVSLDPVKEVAAQVAAALGNIGKQGLIQVTARLAQLDKSLLPFQNRLDIIKSQFDALAAPAKAALDAIDRQAAALQEAVLAGDPAAAERLRVLDQQRDAIQKQLDLQQGLVDRAQIQLGLAQAQQAPERALLTIRKAYLDSLAKAQGTTAADGTPKEKKAPAGAAPINTPEAGATVPSGAAGMPSVLDLVGGTDAIDQATQGLKDAFMGQIDTEALGTLGLNQKALDKQIDRIKSVDIGSKIQDKFKGLSDAFDPSVAGSIANNIWQFFNGSIDNPNSLAGIVDRLGDSLNIDNATAKIKAAFAWVIDPTIDGSPANIFARFTGDASVEGSAAWFFATLPDRISTAVSTLPDSITNSIITPIAHFLTGTEPGTLGDIINQVIGFFTSLPLRIVDALRGIGATIYAAFAVPVIQAINGLIGLVEAGVSGLINEIANFVGSISDALGDASPQVLKDTVANLHGAASNVKFGRISTELPAFLQAPVLAGAKGGIFGKGFMTVGEKGTELMYNASKMGVVPHELTSILMSLQGILAQPSPMMMPAGNNYNNSSSSYTFNNVPSDQNARQRYNTLRAGMR